MENKIYNQQELYDNDINTDGYVVNMEAGTFTGKLVLKAWATRSRTKAWGRCLRAFFDLDDGRQIIALVQPFRSEQFAEMSRAPIGSLMMLWFETSTSGYIFLSRFEYLSVTEECS